MPRAHAASWAARRRLERLGRVPLPIVDEVDYIRSILRQRRCSTALISSRYDARSSLILTSNETLSAWAEIFGDPVAVAAIARAD
ncbi:MAG: ATP-binding protein [Actinobacteria bacterium]|nr:ATP-binding protein [Actinomycetota bacterium]